MNNPTTEQLKKIAEQMGYVRVKIIRDHVWYNHDESKLHLAKAYYPKTNSAQLLEIIEKFKPRIDWINKHLCQVTIYQHKQLPSLIKNEHEGRGETLADAVLQAMIKVIEEE